MSYIVGWIVAVVSERIKIDKKALTPSGRNPRRLYFVSLGNYLNETEYVNERKAGE